MKILLTGLKILSSIPNPFSFFFRNFASTERELPAKALNGRSSRVGGEIRLFFYEEQKEKLLLCITGFSSWFLNECSWSYASFVFHNV
jgi:hypothetical protein